MLYSACTQIGKRDCPFAPSKTTRAKMAPSLAIIASPLGCIDRLHRVMAHIFATFLQEKGGDIGKDWAVRC